eukprot:gene5834-6118_t
MNSLLGSKRGLVLTQQRLAPRKPCVRPVVIVANKNFGGRGSSGSSGGGSAENPLSKFFSDLKGKFDGIFSGSGSSSPWAQGSSRGGSGRGGPPGGGGGDGNGFEDQQPDKPEKPLLEDFLGMVYMSWTVFWNLALFLGFASMMHRSLDWCCQVELLLLVGAPEQAFQRLAGRFFAAVEWVEENILGWDIPKEEGKIPAYRNMALYYPEEHAYTYDAYRYGDKLTMDEKKKLKYAFALRHFERMDGYKGDVDMKEVQGILDKCDPMEADRRAYRDAKLRGELDKWFEERQNEFKS